MAPRQLLRASVGRHQHGVDVSASRGAVTAAADQPKAPISGAHLVRRIGHHDNIAELVCFLASDAQASSTLSYARTAHRRRCPGLARHSRGTKYALNQHNRTRPIRTRAPVTPSHRQPRSSIIAPASIAPTTTVLTPDSCAQLPLLPRAHPHQPVPSATSPCPHRQGRRLPGCSRRSSRNPGTATHLL